MKTTTTIPVLLGLIMAPARINAAGLRRRVQDDRPQNPPKANNDEYDVVEGQSLRVDRPGFLGNDEYESDKSAIYRSQRSTSGMTGRVSTNSDGSFDYTAPPRCWTGDDVFTYRAAYELFPDLESNEARVTIHVKQDGNRPMKPEPQDDKYDLYEGETLRVTAGATTGLLWNDIGGDLLYVAKKIRKHDGFVGDLKVGSDGTFRYISELGATGTFRFDYEACQEGWEACVDCATATVHLNVATSPNRPNPPTAGQPMDFKAIQGQRLDVAAPGVLSNVENKDDRYTLQVMSYGYSGTADMKIRDDGSLRYQSPYSFLGTDPFTYKGCYVEWPDVCFTGSGSVKVEEDPNKPSAPTAGEPLEFQVLQGERLDIPAPGVLFNDEHDTQYTLQVVGYDYNGQADMKVREDGSLRYQSKGDFAGSDAFTYKGCYKEYPDVCYTGSASVKVMENGDSTSRRGVATAYFIQWEGADDDATGCDQVEPRLTLRCEGEGELALLDVGDNDNDSCIVVNNEGNCRPTDKGHIYVECRDGRANNSTNRQLHVSMTSEAVECESDRDASDASTYQVGIVTTLCNDEWVYQGMTCSGQLVQSNPARCYGTDNSRGPTSQVPAIEMSTTNFEQCLFV